MRIAGNRPNSCGGPTSISVFYKVVGVGRWCIAIKIATGRAIGDDGVDHVESERIINASAEV